MTEKTKNAPGEYPLVSRYIARIPEDLRDLLIPPHEHLAQFAAAVKALRTKEEERYYVLDIQRRYRIPIRPNESVKETMIRVRLAILKKRLSADEDEKIADIFGRLPVDPLE
jgi:hypothetical protein